MKRMTKAQKKRLGRILLSAVLWAGIALWEPEGLWGLCYLLPYLIAGYDVLFDAGRNILHGQIFDENFLMCIATIGAFFCGEYPEGVMVMVLFQLGELFQSVAVGRSRDSIAAMMALCPDEARILRDGQEEILDPEEVAVGETIEVWPGEKVPLDGVVLAGESTLDTSPLTGESLPRSLEPGASVYSGCVNLSGTIQVQVTREAGASTAAKILKMMESATEKKAKTEQFITRFARVYTPVVCIGALALAVIPSLITGAWSQWIYRAMTFLVISCPCALVISVPLTFFGGIGMASRNGILVKSGGDLEKLEKADGFVFDKTGTLTQGTFSVVELCPVGVTAEELLEVAAHVEASSNHPIGRSILAAYGKNPDSSRMTSVLEQAGHGVSCVLDGKPVLAGNRKFLVDHQISGLPENGGGTSVFVARDQVYLGMLRCQDQPKEEAREVLVQLESLGVKRRAMLTGDDGAAAEPVGQALGLTEVHSNLLPGDKLQRLEEMLEEHPA